MLLIAALALQSQDWISFEGTQGPGRSKHIVFIAGDEEYRSEEALPQLAKILAARHGFKCTVLFSINSRGEIDPNVRDQQPGLEALKTADLCVIMLRFREWPDEQMKYFANYYLSGKPLIALRTSTHAFNYGQGSRSAYRDYTWNSDRWRGGFGKQVLGETWVSHWGEHGKQATRGIPEPSALAHPVLRGIGSMFGTTDVYEASPPLDVTVLVRGQVLNGMNADSPPALGTKRTSSGREQPLNDPMMPIVWLSSHKNGQGKTNTILTCTMGSATDFLDEDLRRLIVNGCYWSVGLQQKIPAKNDVRLVGDYRPSNFGFDGFKKGVKPADLTLK